MNALTRTAAAVLISTAVSAALPVLAADGKVMTNKSGMTVYTFDKDTSGKSNCNGGCAAAWPPVAADAVAAGGDISAITRDDGSKQAAFKGQPLYTYAADQKAGDATGDGVNNVWHVIRDGKVAKAKSEPAKSAPAPSGYGSGY